MKTPRDKEAPNRVNKNVTIQLGRRVGYEISVGHSAASMTRIGRSVVKHDMLITCMYMTSSDIRMKAFIDPDQAEEVEEVLKAFHFEYRGPTYFDRGSICPIYDSPWDELEDKPCAAYVRFREKAASKKDHQLP